jgi:AcrR family transcriptional regulator
MPDRPTGRRDAARNREQLVAAARAAFTGAAGPVPLESIAAAAGVGIGTLYRHFPSREALVEAVYRSELVDLCAQAAPLLARRRPVSALRAWAGRYIDFVATKRGMAEALREVIASGAVNSADTREHLGAAVSTLLAAGADAGELRRDVRPEDVVAALAGVALAATSRAQADRMLDLLVDSVRVNPAVAAGARGGARRAR